MKAKGMLGMTAAVNELLAGRYSWITSVTTPMASAMTTAPVSDRRRALTTAANAAAIRVVIPMVVRPLVGATRMPATPASIELIAQTPSATRPGLTPEREAIASESTVLRTHSPTSLKRSTKVPATRTNSKKP